MAAPVYRVTAVFDTETANIELGASTWRAYPVAFIANDLRNVHLADYVPDTPKEKIHIWRYASEFLAYLEELVEYGRRREFVPVVCAYNLGFDLQSVIYELSQKYTIRALARSSTHIYTLDLVDEDGNAVLRFWDVFHLETGGLAQMGRIASFPKALGEWDYSLIRTPETPLTDEEIDYATRDVQIIPAYLRYLLDTEQVKDRDDFGFRVITKTSLVRQMARNEIGRYRVKLASGDSASLLHLFNKRCKSELPYSYNCYALRKACFRGGFTFTAARTASTIQRRVQSWDVTSMHHMYLNGRRVGIEYRPADLDTLEYAVRVVLSKSVKDVLRNYERPFIHFFHAAIKFTNIRPKAGTVFERQGIHLLAAGKFDLKDTEALDFETDMRSLAAENDVRAAGFRDTAIGAEFAFGKLVSAESAVIHLSEVELWNVGQVYEWDSLEVITGELTIKSTLPPDYVSMQSNVLYQQKDAAKHINNTYKQGTPYPEEIPDTIPEGLAELLKAGTMDADLFDSWYNSSVKGSYNGIYGTQAQNQLQPDFLVEDGEFTIDPDTRVTPNNFAERLPKKSTVFYTYGLRIVGGSRMHLIIAMLLLDYTFGDGIDVLGGDTDSLKIRVDPEISKEDILDALAPLHEACDRALDICQQRNRRLYENAADFADLGHFDFEGEVPVHYEAWNKARAYFDVQGKAHITCAGLMRPAGEYHIENWMDDMVAAGHSPEEVLSWTLGYNGLVDNSICHALEHFRPLAREKLETWIADYLGGTWYPKDIYQAIAIYNAPRALGDITKKTNSQNVEFIKRHYGRDVDTTPHIITLQDGAPALFLEDAYGRLYREW